MTDKDINQIIEELTNKDSEELIKIDFIEPSDYKKDVSDSAKKELVKRGISKDSDIVTPFLKAHVDYGQEAAQTRGTCMRIAVS